MAYQIHATPYLETASGVVIFMLYTNISFQQLRKTLIANQLGKLKILRHAQARLPDLLKRDWVLFHISCHVAPENDPIDWQKPADCSDSKRAVRPY